MVLLTGFFSISFNRCAFCIGSIHKFCWPYAKMKSILSTKTTIKVQISNSQTKLRFCSYRRQRLIVQPICLTCAYKIHMCIVFSWIIFDKWREFELSLWWFAFVSIKLQAHSGFFETEEEKLKYDTREQNWIFREHSLEINCISYCPSSDWRQYKKHSHAHTHTNIHIQIHYECEWIISKQRHINFRFPINYLNVHFVDCIYTLQCSEQKPLPSDIRYSDWSDLVVWLSFCQYFSK